MGMTHLIVLKQVTFKHYERPTKTFHKTNVHERCVCFEKITKHVPIMFE